MKFKGLKLAVLGLCPLLFACVASDIDLAAQGDWKAIGFKDGARGQTQRPGEDLGKLGEVNLGEYEAGYSEGIHEYCNPNFAYQMGLSGNYYTGICDGTKDAQKFRMEWERGWRAAKEL
jgi:hypothetical protein